MTAPRRPPPDPQPALLVLTGPIARAEVPALCESLEALLRRSGAHRVVCDVGGLGTPDAVTLDALARLRLTAGRCGRELVLYRAGGALRTLLSLTGLSEVLPLCPESPLDPLQTVRQTEEREEHLGVEK
ncbi:STAS domain-containing protein [Peterkaempfera sp. SMS 1(5)a]|uniref:STAS domain-containing protein n=1 Tax=Peterkaempfera podocarpi TaxID=3232308 RepID=UPI00366AD397